ncbi:MAG: hypothetical protein QOD86_2137 [Miltoncostaeaceae bacterium]|jgi:hypothetical protein|nr:hypothetical protein [Miltoncostaeaceae bacterium]
MELNHELDRYLAANDWVTMRRIKAEMGLGWDDARAVWGELLPGLVSMGFVERREAATSRDGAGFRASDAFRAWVAAERAPETAGV